jgi:hypothetical protein
MQRSVQAAKIQNIFYNACYQYFVRRVADSPPKAGLYIGREKVTPESAKSATGGRDILSVLDHFKRFYRTTMYFFINFFIQQYYMAQQNPQHIAS